MSARALLGWAGATALAAALSVTPGVGAGRPGQTAGGPPALEAFEFETASVDARGHITMRRTGRARSFSEDLGAGVALEMVVVPGGAFLMGTAEADVALLLREYERSGADPDDSLKLAQSETPEHPVSVPTFFVGRFEVTQAQWRAVAGMPEVARPLAADPSDVKGDALPVHDVSWDDAAEFCARLSRRTGRPYRLPTEAEWEYACRAGTATRFHVGDAVTPEFVNYDGGRPFGLAPVGGYCEEVLPVGWSGLANAFGLSDMHGNVAEWCLDPWHPDYQGAPRNGGAAWVERGGPDRRVARGGSWYSGAAECRSAARLEEGRNEAHGFVGFRVAFRPPAGGPVR
jgi:formylglycine-generating enzyme required for sulfatase activity